MGRIWVLDTETKGTGAEMVPLDTLRKNRAKGSQPRFNLPKPRKREPKVAPRLPRRFRIVDVLTRAVLADDVQPREALAALRDVRSSVDVEVFVWEPDRERWRLLTLAEQRVMWERRMARPRLSESSTGESRESGSPR